MEIGHLRAKAQTVKTQDQKQERKKLLILLYKEIGESVFVSISVPRKLNALSFCGPGRGLPGELFPRRKCGGKKSGQKAATDGFRGNMVSCVGANSGDSSDTTWWKRATKDYKKYSMCLPGIGANELLNIIIKLSMARKILGLECGRSGRNVRDPSFCEKVTQQQKQHTTFII